MLLLHRSTAYINHVSLPSLSRSTHGLSSVFRRGRGQDLMRVRPFGHLVEFPLRDPPPVTSRHTPILDFLTRLDYDLLRP